MGYLLLAIKHQQQKHTPAPIMAPNVDIITTVVLLGSMPSLGELGDGGALGIFGGA